MKTKINFATEISTLLKPVAVHAVKAFDLNDMAILIRYEQRNSWNKRKSILQYHLFIKFTCQIYFFFQLPLDKVI